MQQSAICSNMVLLGYLTVHFKPRLRDISFQIYGVVVEGSTEALQLTKADSKDGSRPDSLHQLRRVPLQERVFALHPFLPD
ncbi:unnamed protein product [Periconia digitata]|uniref:Uncharacterized protein n=1 Tax=Periconia digitata TaxID=1303443 RepID=A0A9W4UD98_9PLEO|nr:unnamed protein product [Periconia digitata]